jgi:two-component system cell cycle sensor histidine kinase/response regulator CckA
LSTVFGIVRQTKGPIAVESQPGRGTRFRVYLPRSDEAVAQVAPAPSACELRGTGTILLVEDEEQVRRVTRTILARNGYQVLEASNAGEALLICEQHRGEIDLILSDVIMPRMSGIELARRLGPLRPRARVLFMSGYTDVTQLDPAAPYLQKPITPESLLAKVHEVLR